MLVFLPANLATADARLHPGYEVDVAWSGRQVSEWELWTITKKILPFDVINTTDLEPTQVSQMGRVLGVRPSAIDRFRWGPSMAPPAHRLAGSYWYTVWYTTEEGRRVLTLRLDANRYIVERVHWRRISGPNVALDD